MSSCTYTFNTQDGEVTIKGMEAMKAFLVKNGVESIVGNGKIDQTNTPAFKAWFGDSKVVDDSGNPLVVYRGEHGNANKQIHSRMTAIYFGNQDAANTYASEPNDSKDVVEAPRVIPAYLKISNPIVNQSDDPFIEGSHLAEMLGVDEARRLLVKFADQVEYTGNWMEDINLDGKYSGVADYLAKNKDGHKNLYFAVYPLLQDNQEVASFKSKGFDGAIHGGSGATAGEVEYAVFSEGQIKSAIGNNGKFDPSNPDIRESRRERTTGDFGRQYSQDQLNFFKNVGRTTDVPTLRERLKEFRKDLGKKMAQGIADQFVPLKDLGGNAYTLARLSKGASGAFEALLHHGKLSIKDGVYDADMSGGFVNTVGKELGPELEDFMWWIAANRADRLSQEDREHLFTPQDIAAGKGLASGQMMRAYTLANGQTTTDRAAAYADALKRFDAFNKNVLDIAEESGLIDGEARKIWDNEFYVPFYRVSEEDGAPVGNKIKGGMVRQRAFKQLKGGAQKLNSDLTANVMQNWAHLIDASAKNRAAKATLESAHALGIAIEASQEIVNQMAKSIGAKSSTVWFLDQGRQRHFLVEDPYILEAINSLEYAGLRGPLMDALSKTKHWLTIGVTASPAFKVRNLIRDSLQAIAVADLSYNPIKNLSEGIKNTNRESQVYVSALAAGGLMRFGTSEASQAERVRQLVSRGVPPGTILDTKGKLMVMYNKYLRPGIDAYQELGDRGEEINRASLYKQLRDKGIDHATAALMARDLMDFSMQGTFKTVRFLTQVVPFLNARIQGLYKLGKSAKEDPKRFGIVVGAVAMASIALMAAYGDDEDWKRREDWDRDGFWWFKFGGVAFRIPKPFEVGAIASVAERGVELFTNDEFTTKRFLERLKHIASDNLSMNPIPQAVKPILDVYANKDSFNGRPIETLSMERLQAEYRYTSSSSMLARGLSSAMNAVTRNTVGADTLSPVQIDSLIRGYTGWLGTTIVGASDWIVRQGMDEPKRPAPDWWKVASQNFIQEVPSGQSKYVSAMYDQLDRISEAYNTHRQLIKEGKVEDAREFAADNKELLQRYRVVESVKQAISNNNKKIRAIELGSLSPEEKKRKILELKERNGEIARKVY